MRSEVVDLRSGSYDESDLFFTDSSLHREVHLLVLVEGDHLPVWQYPLLFVAEEFYFAEIGAGEVVLHAENSARFGEVGDGFGAVVFRAEQGVMEGVDAP